MDNIKVDVYTLCYNEMKIAPFVVQYWKEYANKVVVYDNGSDDGSIEYLGRFPFIEIRHFDSDGLNDEINIQIKNSVWKESRNKSDFVVVCDFDECIYSPNLIEELKYMKKNGMTLCKPREYVMLSDEFPVFDSNKFSYQIMKTGYSGRSKYLIFDPNKILEINYLPGAHICNPIGEIKAYDGNRIFNFHHAEMCMDYIIDKYHSRQNRFSYTNKKNGYGMFYFVSDDEIISDINNKLKNRCVNIINIVNQKIKIFVCTFDKEVKIKSDIFVPLQVGRSVCPVKLDCLGDDTGDNISNKNKYYSEQTGVYWVWKNLKEDHPDYIGFCHYRKYPYFRKGIHQQEFRCSKEFYVDSGGMDEKYINDAILKRDVACIAPFFYSDRSIETLYKSIHVPEDFDILKEIINEMYPEYMDSFNKIARQIPGAFFPYNIYIMKWKIFDEYCSFIFSIFEKMEGRIDKKKHIGYQSRVFGYLAERLLSVFLLNHEYKTSIVPCSIIDEYEDPDYTTQDKN